MAGLLFVLHGHEGGFKKATPLLGSDGNPLILPRADGDERADTNVICTRQFVCDLDADGKLDLVVGNFAGTFGWFRGEDGGKFAPKATWLMVGDTPLRVEMHSDPFLCDVDRDGDLDLLSGSARGGVFLFRNAGTKQAPRFTAAETLLAPPTGGHDGPRELVFGDDLLKAPGDATRVWADDVDGDGKLDLLVGDTVQLFNVAKGVTEADARAKDAEWQRKLAELMKTPPEGDAAMEKWSQSYEALEKEREQFIVSEQTGFVWLLKGK